MATNNISADNSTTTESGRFVMFDENGVIRIPLYVTIFLLSIIGNTLVIITLLRNRRMRTVTNVFLLNLSISDLLLAVFCMPFTLVPLLMRDFIFGEFMCVVIRYIQAVSVCVNCYTLVTISMERFFAICYPLRSRRWQTLSHAYKLIVGIWTFAFLVMIPIAISNELMTLRNGNNACREIWPKHLRHVEVVYSIFLVLILLLFPLMVMVVAYGKTSYKLWFTIKQQVQQKSGTIGNLVFLSAISSASYVGNISLRQSNQHFFNKNRKRVIKMLFVIVLEYFLCWSPLYILNTWKVVDYMSIHERVSSISWSLVLLLAYSSSCIHPITYCFMNKKFRVAFLNVFPCLDRKFDLINRTNSQLSQINLNTLQSSKVRTKEECFSKDLSA